MLAHPLEQGPVAPRIDHIEPRGDDSDRPARARGSENDGVPSSPINAPPSPAPDSPSVPCSTARARAAASAAWMAPWCAAPSIPMAKPDTTDTPAAPRKAPSSHASARPCTEAARVPTTATLGARSTSIRRPSTNRRSGRPGMSSGIGNWGEPTTRISVPRLAAWFRIALRRSSGPVRRGRETVTGGAVAPCGRNPLVRFRIAEACVRSASRWSQAGHWGVVACEAGEATVGGSAVSDALAGHITSSRRPAASRMCSGEMVSVPARSASVRATR